MASWYQLEILLCTQDNGRNSPLLMISFISITDEIMEEIQQFLQKTNHLFFFLEKVNNQLKINNKKLIIFFSFFTHER